MKGLILFIIAYLLLFPFTIINFCLVWNKQYFQSTAVDIDKFGNREFRTMLNTWLRTSNGYAFGNENETISSALGKNQRDGTLTKCGTFIVWILDKIQKNHCQISINNSIN